MSDLKVQKEMGAISKRTVIEKSPYTTDVSQELERIEAEKVDVTSSKEDTTPRFVQPPDGNNTSEEPNHDS